MMSEVAVRPGTPDDLQECARIINDWIDTTAWMPRVAPREEIAASFNSSLLDLRHFLVAHSSGATAGYLSLDAEKCYIHGLYVDKKFRNIGTGTALLNSAKTDFPNGLSLSTFQANAGARKFYEREGFAEIQRRDGDNAEKLPDILYRWQGEVCDR